MKKAFGIWSTLPRVWPYVRPYRRLAVVSLLLTLAAAVVALAEPWPLAIMVDNVLGARRSTGVVRLVFGESPGRYTLLAFAVLTGFALTFATHATSVITEWVNAKLEQRMVLDLRSDLFNHCQGLSLTFHDERLTGQLMNQINYQAAAVGAIVMAFPPIVQSALTLIGMLVVAALIDWEVALVSLIAVPFIWWSLGLYGTRIVPRLQRVQALEWQSLSIVHEAMAMLRVIVSFGREGHEYRRFRSQGEVAVDERVKLTLRQTLFSLGVTSATALGTGLVLGFGAVHVIQGKITIGELLVLTAYVAAVYQPLEQISTTVGNLNEQFVQFNSAVTLLDTPKEVEEAPDALDVGRSSGEVTFEGVGFAYRGRKDTLRDISLRAEPGQRVAVVGPTGAGKTTLMSLLIRFYDPHAGRVCIDGVDIRRLTLASLRAQISVVLQEPLLFSGTIADNIRYGRLEASMDDVVAAARAANAHEFIERQPKGYDTVLGERGAQLSGGERQRISVARAFVRDAPILILDEPTSSIDSKTEGVILDALDELMERRTSFMIAHRLSTVRDADLIVVLSDGRIVEQGSHEELLELDGTYRQLHEAQNRERRRRRRSRAVVATVGGSWDVPALEDRPPDGDFDAPARAAQAPETREEALAAGDFDALDGEGPARPWPAVAYPGGAAADEADGPAAARVPAHRRRARRLAMLACVSLAAGALIGTLSAPDDRGGARAVPEHG
ncbi:MAG TPA: ABC transporter ATP-binding protein, partial [Solirubrobacteraceae bacterium]